MRTTYVDTEQSTFDKPLIKFQQHDGVVDIRTLPEEERLKHDALFAFVDVEVELMELLGSNYAMTEIGERIAELKLRLFGSLVAGG